MKTIHELKEFWKKNNLDVKLEKRGNKFLIHVTPKGSDTTISVHWMHDDDCIEKVVKDLKQHWFLEDKPKFGGIFN